jgi:hypothetical protein
VTTVVNTPQLATRSKFSVSPPPPPCPVHHGRHRPLKDCRRCRARNRWLMTTRKSALQVGQWEIHVPAGPVRERLSLLVARVGWEGTVRLTGLSKSGIGGIIRGGQPYVAPATRDKVMAAPIPDRSLPKAGYTWAFGTTRRVRGLAVDGWTTGAIASRAGVPPNTIRRMMDGTQEWVALTTAEKITAVADELHGLHGGSTVTANRAARRGWPSLDAWDDIDDPDCQPNDGVVDAAQDVDSALVELILAGYAVRPACWRKHPRTPAHRDGVCDPCIRWRTNRNEAIRVGTLRRWTAKRMAEVTGEKWRTIMRIRAEQRRKQP